MKALRSAPVPSALGLVRRAATAPGIRLLTSVTPVVRAAGALRGVLVREPVRFAMNELRPRNVAARYRVRGGGAWVVIRHHTSDVMILDEIFSAGEYDPPPPADAILSGFASPRVVDLGANVGMFGVWMLTRAPRATIVGYEPDPANIAVHERVIELNRARERWTLQPVAAATAAGRVSFRAGLGSASFADPDGETVVPAADAFEALLSCDFAKIDIEGGEWALLEDSRFAQLPARVLFLEYHSQGCPGADPAAEASARVAAAGYTVHHRPKLTTGVGAIWAWRE
jgi:FkbM family methyltransferase